MCDGRCSGASSLATTVVRGRSAPCTAREQMKEALHTYFKYSEFRPGQVEAVLPAIHGQDVFVRMATGSGKSLCSASCNEQLSNGYNHQSFNCTDGAAGKN